MANSDFRHLPKRPDLRALVEKFESIGVSCELGLVQRHCGLDRPGLLRFALSPFDGLVAALDANFAGMADQTGGEFFESGNGEWLNAFPAYGIERHTRLSAKLYSEAEARQRMRRHVGFLVQKLICDIEHGEKILVYRADRADRAGNAGRARVLLDALSAYGPAKLLWVELAERPAQVSGVEWTIPGRLMTGYLDRFAPHRFAAGLPFDGWLAMLGAAFSLDRNQSPRPVALAERDAIAAE